MTEVEEVVEKIFTDVPAYEEFLKEIIVRYFSDPKNKEEYESWKNWVNKTGEFFDG